LGSRLAATKKIPLRGLLGRPLRTIFIVFGIAMALPMVVLVSGIR
jgi:hypothetical protein